MIITNQLLIRVRALTGFRELVHALGGDPAPLLAAAGIEASLLDKPDATLPLAQLGELLALAAQRLDRPDFGLCLSEHQDISVLGIVATIARHSPTVGAAIDGVARHLPYHTPGGTLTAHSDPATGLTHFRYVLHLDENAGREQAMALSYAIAFKYLHLIAGSDTSEWRMHFRHLSSQPAAYARTFACPVLFSQAHDELIFPSALLNLPIDPERSDLRQTAERFINNVLRRYPLDIGRQVEALVDRQLSIGGGSIDRVAAQLGLHRRTLQRRLATQSLYFDDIVDTVRRTRALEYLQHPAIPLTQVSALLGYSEQSSLNRACLRWFGQTPATVRLGGGKMPASRRR